MKLLVAISSEENTEKSALPSSFSSLSSGHSLSVLPMRLEEGRNWKRGGYSKIALRHAVDHAFDAVLVVEPGKIPKPNVVQRLLTDLEQNPHAGALVVARQTCADRIYSFISGTQAKGWASTLKVYRTSALSRTAFFLNSNEDHFDTELFLQFHQLHIPLLFIAPEKEWRVGQKSIRWNSLKTCLKFRLQRYHLFYDFRYHPEWFVPGAGGQKISVPPYTFKLEPGTPHSFVCQESSWVPRGSKVLDIGCASGYVGQWLAEHRDCQVTGVDRPPLLSSSEQAGFRYEPMDIEADIDRLCALIQKEHFDVILMLDVLEHLAIPEVFLWKILQIPYTKRPRLVVSTGNVSFIVIRLMLLMGYFNYGEKGILDITHKRLFSWRTFKNLFDQMGIQLMARRGFPIPYQLLGFPSPLARFFRTIHTALIRIRPSLFAYQILVVVEPFPVEKISKS